MIELNKSLFIYENDKLAICKVYKDDYIKRYFRNVGNRMKDLFEIIMELILYILILISECILELIICLSDFIFKFLNLTLDLIRALLSFLPIIMIKNYEKNVIEAEWKEDK